MSEDKYVFVQNIVFIVLQIFWNVQKKCLQTAYYFLLGMFSFEYSLVWLNKNVGKGTITNISLLLLL